MKKYFNLEESKHKATCVLNPHRELESIVLQLVPQHMAYQLSKFAPTFYPCEYLALALLHSVIHITYCMVFLDY